MNREPGRLRVAAAVLGASGIGLGAFGAHALKNHLSAVPGRMDNWKTAVVYQLFHAVAVLSISVLSEQHQQKFKTESVAVSPPFAAAGKCMVAGTVLFSGSIYMLCLEIGPKKLLGPTTPLGGLLMMAGWTMLGLQSSE